MRHWIVVVLLIATACSPSEGGAEPSITSTTTATTTSATEPPTTTTTIAPDFGITSPAFDDGAMIPPIHTCDGADVSPELTIVGLPEATQSVVLVVDDPDAPLGTWDHWVEFDITFEAGSIDFARDTDPIGVQGVNSWNLPGYRGPCPPAGEEHNYFFTVYALDQLLDLPSGVDSAAVYDAMDGAVIESVELTGVYGR